MNGDESRPLLHSPELPGQKKKELTLAWAVAFAFGAAGMLLSRYALNYIADDANDPNVMLKKILIPIAVGAVAGAVGLVMGWIVDKTFK